MQAGSGRDASTRSHPMKHLKLRETCHIALGHAAQCIESEVRLPLALQNSNAPMEKGHFTWVTTQGRQERWIVASCGNYTVLWNFRPVSCAAPLAGPPWLGVAAHAQEGRLCCMSSLCVRSPALVRVCTPLRHAYPCELVKVAEPDALSFRVSLGTPLALPCRNMHVLAVMRLATLPAPCSRSVKVAEPDTLSFGGLTTVTTYHMVKKGEQVVSWLSIMNSCQGERGRRACACK